MKQFIVRQIAGPLTRRADSPRHSECGSAKLHTLNWDNWFQDSGYIHVSAKADETWHRVHPKPVKGYTCTRLAVYNGVLHWLHDPIV